MRIRSGRKLRQMALNVFCPTGEGGGVDPSCGKSESHKVEVRGHLYEVVINPSKVQLSNWLKNVPPIGLKGLVTPGNRIAVFGPDQDGYEAFHDEIYEKLGGGTPKWGDRFRITADSLGRTVVQLHENPKHSHPAIERWGRRLGLVVNKLTINPFVSEAQRAWMHINEPEMAERWEAHTPKGKKLPKKVTANRRKNPLRLDPTRTITLRQQFSKEVKRRFSALKVRIERLIVDEDALGLKETRHEYPLANTFCPTGEGGGVDPTCSTSGVSSKIEIKGALVEVVSAPTKFQLTNWLNHTDSDFLKGISVEGTVMVFDPQDGGPDYTVEHHDVYKAITGHHEQVSGWDERRFYVVRRGGEPLVQINHPKESRTTQEPDPSIREWIKKQDLVSNQFYSIEVPFRNVEGSYTLILNYSPDQLRDERGRWTGGGESGPGRQTPPTSMGTAEKYRNSDGSWKKERLAIHEKVLNSFTEKVTKPPDGKKILYMTGGGFGSGKSTLLDKFPEHVGFPNKSESPVCDPDAAKQFLPEMAQRVAMGDRGAASYVHEESSLLGKQGVSMALAKGYSPIYDTSGDSDPGKLHTKVEGYRKEGATKVIAHYATPLSFDEAMSRVEARQSKSQGVRRELSRAQVEVNHREVSRCWQAAATRGTFDELGLWSTAGKFGDPPSKIAHAKGGVITVHDHEAYKKFLDMGK